MPRFTFSSTSAYVGIDLAGLLVEDRLEEAPAGGRPARIRAARALLPPTPMRPPMPRADHRVDAVLAPGAQADVRHRRHAIAEGHREPAHLERPAFDEPRRQDRQRAAASSLRAEVVGVRHVEAVDARLVLQRAAAAHEQVVPVVLRRGHARAAPGTRGTGPRARRA